MSLLKSTHRKGQDVVRDTMRRHDISRELGFMGLAPPSVEMPRMLLEHAQLGEDLPELNRIGNGALKDRVRSLRVLADYELVLLKKLPRQQLIRAAVTESFIVQSYIQQDWHTPRTRLPPQLARTMYALGVKLKMSPLLVYQYYTLANWRLLNKKKPITVDNVVMLQHFNSKEFPIRRRSEHWFIAIHIEIEAAAGLLIESAFIADWALGTGDYGVLSKELKTILRILPELSAILKRMPECCDPETYYHHVRPYLMGFSAIEGGVVYEGVPELFEYPQFYRGQTGAQSSIAPLLDILLCIEHSSAILSNHLDAMLSWHTPFPQRSLLLEMKSDIGHRKVLLEKAIGDANVAALVRSVRYALAQFRKVHYEHAINFIARPAKRARMNAVNDAGEGQQKGTGGTDFIESLRQHIHDTLHPDDHSIMHGWNEEWHAMYRAPL